MADKNKTNIVFEDKMRCLLKKLSDMFARLQESQGEIKKNEVSIEWEVK